MGVGDGNRGTEGRREASGLESNTQEHRAWQQRSVTKVFKKLKQNNASLKACFHYLKVKASLGNRVRHCLKLQS